MGEHAVFFFSLGFGAFFVAAAWMNRGKRSTIQADEVRAHRFVVVDEAGSVRARLYAEKGSVNLVLYDEEGRPGSKLSPGYLILHDRGRIRAWINAGGKEEANLKDATLVLGDEDDHVRCALFASKAMSGLTLGDQDGRVRYAVSASKAESSVELFDEAGHSRASLNLSGDGPALRLYGADGKLLPQ